jgi:hypothetical protein
MDGTRTLTLTNEQWANLGTWLLVTKAYGASEIDKWQEMAQEVNKDGTQKFPRAKGNAEFYRAKLEQMEEIRKIIEA